ncbi:hypothetical protein Bca52824_087253 [Brassica carinata]|uniref:Uncharacterized protein n=1 Tax=Brassica carinata TaxID=52824 RepID=A0A8X7PAI9_BRACI|nr:hypothetical protein Bca52824_087253 [Brassica carinata]
MQCSGVEEIWGGSVYDPAYYTFLFEETQTNMNSPKRWKGHWKLLELKSKAAKFWERKEGVSNFQYSFPENPILENLNKKVLFPKEIEGGFNV